MSEHGTGRFGTDGYGGLSDAEAERLLSYFDGVNGGMPATVEKTGGVFAASAANATGSTAETVARVLAAAAAQPHPHELRGYEPVRHAFESGGARGRHVASLPLRRLAGVKLAALAGTLTVAGVAVAAEADILPSPIQRVAHQMLGGIGVPEPDHDGNGSGLQTATGGPDGGASGGPNGSSTQHQPTGASGNRTGDGTYPVLPTASADLGQDSLSADLIALCQAFDGHNGSALSGSDRHRLATLAGGEKYIADYCARVLGAANANPGLPSTPQPTGPGAGQSTQPNPSAGTGTDPSRYHSHSTDPNGNGHSHTPDPSRTH